MRITFVLPGFIAVPMGGVKVVHEYANRLTARGHRVTLIYPLRLQTNLLYRLKKALIRFYDRLSGNQPELYYTPVSAVTVLTVKNVSDRYIPDADAVIAVGWQTAEPVCRLATTKGRKYYLLQSFETYFRNRQTVLQTYHLPLQKIAISDWIIDELRKINEEAEGRMPNAIDSSEFYLENQNSHRTIDILMLYHPAKIKGARDAFTIFKQLKKKRPGLMVSLIAARRPFYLLPAWIRVHIRPSVNELRQLYNQSRIFLHTSYWEGWPLPVMEAMACGCAIVAYRNRGVSEYLTHAQNALLAPVGDTDTLIQYTISLLDNAELRDTIVKNGLKTIRQYSWESSTDIFENILIQKANEHKKTKVSIIIPAYNAAKSIETCLSALLQQTYSTANTEIHIVNDGSDDNTLNVLEVLNLPDYVYIHTHNKNRGLAAARNTGIVHSKGDIIIFLDADMEVFSDFIAAHIAYHEKPGVIGVVSALIPDLENPPDKYQKYIYSAKRGAKKYPGDSPLPFHVFIMGVTSIKSEVLKKTGFFDDQITRYGGEDTEFAYRLWQKYPEGLYYAPHIKVIHHHYRPFNEVLKNVETFGREVVPYLVQKHPEFDKLYGYSLIFPPQSFTGLIKNIAGKIATSGPTDNLLTAFYRLSPYPFSNRIIRLRLAAALLRGVRQSKSATPK